MKKKIDLVEQEEKYVAFLKKALQSENFKSKVSEEEYEKTKKKYDKAKFKLKMLKQK
jgi:16S rRNA G527 N7-methylase RsmG